MIRLALLGHPVAHSRSPAMMRAALDAMSLEGVYVPFDVAPDQLADAVTGIAALGFDGANVTLPHKSTVMPLLARADSTARLVGAVNTLAREGPAYVGHNTDTEGLLGTLRVHGVDPNGADVVVLGGGGAARASAVGVALAGARSVHVIARQGASALSVAEAVQRAAPRCQVLAHELGTTGAEGSLEHATLVLQSTSCGMPGGPSSDELLAGADLARCTRGAAAMDLVYVPAITAWMEAADRAGMRVLAGAGADMLARQGAAALRHWTRREPPLDVMRAALDL